MFKAKLQLKFGSVAMAAAKLRCSASALRYAAEGKCPRVLERMKTATAGVEVSLS